MGRKGNQNAVKTLRRCPNSLMQFNAKSHIETFKKYDDAVIDSSSAICIYAHVPVPYLPAVARPDVVLCMHHTHYVTEEGYQRQKKLAFPYHIS
jgi:hypothetical protein